MACLTSFFQPVVASGAGPAWLWGSAQPILGYTSVADHVAAKQLSDEQRAELSEQVAKALNTMTQRGEDNGWVAMSSAGDKTQGQLTEKIWRH